MLALDVGNGRVALVAETNGPIVAGSASERERPRYGLLGMQERTTALGGEFAAGPTPNGWRVTCELPVEERGSR
jgi:signal transduction histidine kinase